ncbi:MAG: segregation/condensation protein A [Deltaproteobacteria bacterium]|nr:segregation/condensation protein A [Deltaproteobacteria bacterium]
MPRPPEPYKVELPIFEGPLDLLLHLCQKHELDILDIPIAFVTQKYLEYLGLMQALNLDVASEYLLMAATLAHIKSRMLVPSDPSETEDDLVEEGGDPREELIRRLLEYQRYKEAASLLAGGLMVGRDTFLRGAPVAETGGEAPLAEMEIFSLLSAFQRILERVRADISHDVTVDRISVTERINELAEILRVRGQVMFEELFDGQTTRIEMVTTLLAILEMTRLKLTRVYQAEPRGAIHISLAVAPDEEAGATDSGDGVPHDG